MFWKMRLENIRRLAASQIMDNATNKRSEIIANCNELENEINEQLKEKKNV